MKILLIGPKKASHGRNYRTSAYFQYLALKKIYKKVDIINFDYFFPLPILTRRIFYHISAKIFEPFLNNYISSRIKKNYDLIYVTNSSAAYIGKKLITKLKKKTKKIILFLEDNAFSKRDKNRFQLYRSAAPHYDLTVTFHKSRITMGKKYGLKKTLLVLPTYQKNVHCKHKISNKENKILSSNVIFIGTWFPERGIFFKKLIDLGLDIKIYGNRWKKDPDYSLIKSKITLGHVHDPLYSKLIQCSKISLCLPSLGNVDGLTRRSIEIPAIGTLLCATRTPEHKNLFIENREAIFFNDAKECYKKCVTLLKNEKKIKQIANNGYVKVTKVLKPDYLSTIKAIMKKVN